MDWRLEEIAKTDAGGTGELSGLQRELTALAKEMMAAFSNRDGKLAAAQTRALADGLATVRMELLRLKTAVSEALAPLMNAVLPGIGRQIGKLTSFMQSVGQVTAKLFGGAADIEAVTKAEKAYISTTQRLKRKLAAFDEIRRLPATAGGAAKAADEKSEAPLGETGGALRPAVEALQKRIWEIKSWLADAYAPAVSAWQRAGQSLAAAWERGIGRIGTALNGLWTEGLSPFLGMLLGQWVPGIVNSLSEAFAPITAGGLAAAFQLLVTGWENGCRSISSAAYTVLQPCLALIQTVWQSLMGSIQTGWSQYGSPVLTNVIAMVESLWSEHLYPLGNRIGQLLGSVAEAVLAVWNHAVVPVFRWMSEVLAPGLSQVWEGVARVVTDTLGAAADRIGRITEVCKAVLDMLTQVFMGQWSAVWDSMKRIASSAWEAMKGNVKGTVNNIIGMINGLIGGIVSGINGLLQALNRLQIQVPDWIPLVGGNSFGFSLPTLATPRIPYLAQGAVLPANRPFLAMLGDQRHGTNVEAPLATIQEAVAAVMADFAGSNLAGHEATVAVLREILAAVLGIEIGDDVIGRAYLRYRDGQAVMKGGAL